MNEDMLQKLEQIGWWDGVPAEERARVEAAVRGEQEGDAYLHLATLSFDTECIDGFGPRGGDLGSYHELLEYYGRASRGRFQPTDIVDALQEASGTVKVGFTDGGNRYEITVPYDSDWFQAEVHELVNRALEARGGEERFVILPAIDQVIYAVLARPAVVEKAIEVGAIPSMQSLLTAQGFDF